jgi:hypothetical protein
VIRISLPLAQAVIWRTLFLLGRTIADTKPVKLAILTTAVLHGDSVSAQHDHSVHSLAVPKFGQIPHLEAGGAGGNGADLTELEFRPKISEWESRTRKYGSGHGERNGMVVFAAPSLILKPTKPNSSP